MTAASSRRAHDDASASLARLRPLLAIAALTDGAHELEPLLAELSTAIVVALEPRRLVLHVYRPAWDDFVVAAVHGDAAEERGTTTEWKDWRPLLDDAITTPRAYYGDDVLFVPLAHSDGHLLGILSVSWDEEPGDEALDLLTTVAALGARSLEQAQRNVERARADAAIEHLHTVSVRLMSPTSADSVLGAVSDGIDSALGFEKVAIVLRDGDSLVPVAHSGWEPGDAALDFRITEDEIAGLFEPRFEVEGCYLLTREDAVARCTTGSRYASQLNGRGPWAWNRHWLLAPLYDDRGKMAGFIWADDPSDRLLPSRERLRVLRMFANHAATALELARTFEAEHDATERLRASITASPLATFSLDHDAIVTSWNPAAERLYGWTAAEVVGRPYPLVSLERRLEFEHLLRSVLDGSSFSGLELVRVANDGRRVEVSASAAPLRNADGEVVGAIVLHEDITERKQAERQLERRHRELGALHATTLDLIETLDEEGVLAAIVQRACGLIGTEHGYVFLVDEEQDELVCRHGRGAFHEVVGGRLQRGEGVAGAVWAGGELLSIEDYAHWTGRSEQYGKLKFHAVAGVPLRSRRGVIGVFGIGRVDDTTFTRADLALLEQFGRLASLALDNARAYTELRKSEELYARVVETSTESIFLFELDGTVAFASRSNEAILGYKPEELVGRPFSEFSHPDDVPAAMEVVQHAVDTGELRTYDMRVRHRNGHWVALEGKPAPVRDDAGNVDLILAVARDVTEREANEEQRRELEEQLRQSQKLEAVGRLSGGIAHDFNNLLTAISGYGGLALGSVPEGADELRSDVEEMLAAAERARQLIRQLLAFSRKQVMQPRVLDLNEVVRDMQSILGRLIGEDIELVTELDVALGSVLADPGQIEQVIMNLALNARDAMEAGGRLLIETRNEGVDEPVVTLRVVDTGHGMTHDVRERVFEPFFTTKSEAHGTGLGLSTVYGIVTQSGGTIHCESEPGAGSTFTVQLPRIDEDSMAAAPEKTEAVALTGSETVLVAEDEDVVRRLVAESLGRLGYTVLVAENGRDAVAMLADAEVDLVLTDVVMPGMGGRELAAWVREHRPRTRVVFMSGYDSDAANAEPLDAPLLEKPFTAACLGAQVRAALDA